ncbi:MAG: hypothetical protein WC966_03360 [Bradymonadales bacterium]|jgi:hypothetical protein
MEIFILAVILLIASSFVVFRVVKKLRAMGSDEATCLCDADACVSCPYSKACDEKKE